MILVLLPLSVVQHGFPSGDILGGGSLDERCKLYCSVANTNIYYKMQEKVVDGTPCEVDSYDICVNGVCQPAGCDHVLSSTVKLGMLPPNGLASRPTPFE